MKHFANLILICFFLSACKKESEVLNLQETPLVNSEIKLNILSEQDAMDVADVFRSKTNDKKMPNRPSRSSSSIKTILNDENSPMFYVVNHEGGGWTIVSAKQDYYPILAYSDTKYFQLDNTNKNIGLDIWIDETIQAIEESGNLNQQTSSYIAFEWMKYNPQNSDMERADIPTGNSPEAVMCRNRLKELNETYYKEGWSFRTLASCKDIKIPDRIYNRADEYRTPYEYTIIGIKDVSQSTFTGPLLTTTWDQYNSYNALCPNQYPAGCVPIAMAQIMNFHEYPYTFDWNNMLDNQATYASQYLIADIGKTIKVDYSPDGSSSNISEAKKGFEHYGYSAVIKDHNNSKAASEIVNNKRPIYMRGQNEDNGHAWVSDGFWQNISKYNLYAEYVYNGKYDNLGYTLIDNPDEIRGTSQIYFHMNWGWNGNSNGWYINAQTDDGYNFNKNRKNLYISIK